MADERRQYFGKYQGKVVGDEEDPLRLGRVKVSVPAVVGAESLAWAMPCVPYAGRGVGWVATPPAGTNVWVEFEGGDPDYPIWTGCFWGPGELPGAAKTAQTKVFATETLTVTLDDTPEGGGLTIEVGGGGTRLRVSASGVEVSHARARVSLGDDSGAVRVQTGASRLEISPGSLALQVGAASVELNPVMVNINKGALEVM